MLHMSETCTETRGHGFQSTWLPLATWVCRHWREVAQETPQLWSSIDINVRHCNAEAINALFERAGKESLSVSIDGTALDMPTACALVQPQGRRIAQLTIHLEESQTSTVDVLLLHLGPKLDVLQLFCTASAKENALTLDPQTMPNLRKLHINDIFVRPMTKLNSLCDLTVQYLWGVESSEQKLGEYFYELLAACPNLECLDIIDALPGANNLDDTSTSILNFPKLRCLWVSELALDVPKNLAHFVIPPSASLSLTARYDECPPEWDDETAVMPMKILPESRFENIPALAQTKDLCLHLGAKCCTPNIQVSGGNWTVSVPDMQDINDGQNHIAEYAAHVLDGLAEMVIPANIVYLQLHVAQHMPEYEDWKGVLAAFPNVVGLTIGGQRAFRGAIAAMRTHRKVLLPKLVQMTICIASALNIKMRFDSKAFAGWLADRAKAGKPLESLIVQVPEAPLNTGTVHLAGSLIAYMAVRGGRVGVDLKDCATCHGDHEH